MHRIVAIIKLMPHSIITTCCECVFGECIYIDHLKTVTATSFVDECLIVAAVDFRRYFVFHAD